MFTVIFALSPYCLRLFVKLIFDTMSGKKRKRLLAVLLALTYLGRKRLTMEISKRSIWVRKVFANKGKSDFWNLYQELKADVRENYSRYLRMSKERFEHLCRTY